MNFLKRPIVHRGEALSTRNVPNAHACSLASRRKCRSQPRRPETNNCSKARRANRRRLGREWRGFLLNAMILHLAVDLATQVLGIDIHTHLRNGRLVVVSTNNCDLMSILIGACNRAVDALTSLRFYGRQSGEECD